MLSILKHFFGSKTDRDFREIKPIYEAILKAYETIKGLTNDQLRGKTAEFKLRIKENIKTEQEQIEQLQGRIVGEHTLELDEKEKIYQQIDALQKAQDQKTETILLEILPEAFSVIKETARRFKEGEVRVQATQFDRDLAAIKPSISIEGDTAVYQNQWMAGGNMITWDMVHYDVQLIGGIHLHSGKIAEMATGEGKTLVATLPVYLNALPGKGVHIVTVNDYLSKRTIS